MTTMLILAALATTLGGSPARPAAAQQGGEGGRACLSAAETRENVSSHHLREPMAGGAKLVLTITDEAGQQVRRLELPDESGIHRVTWDLRRNPPAPPPAARAGGAGGRARQGDRVETGRYTATLGRLAGGQVTALGKPQTVLVVPLER